jgi:hypothetical protein
VFQVFKSIVRQVRSEPRHHVLYKGRIAVTDNSLTLNFVVFVASRPNMLPLETLKIASRCAKMHT